MDYNLSVMAKTTYTSCGVDYEALDAFKQLCHRAALSTRKSRTNDVVELEHASVVHVQEGLGTKTLVADEFFKLTGTCHYRSIGIDLVAAIVNDVVSAGAMPLSLAMHLAAGSSAWFGDLRRATNLVEGFAEGCRLAGAAWAGGETSVLKDVVIESSIVLSGSAIGLIDPKRNRLLPCIQHRDAIVFIASSGVHANGLTLCRRVAGQLPNGLLTPLDDGRSFGQALLTPSVIYVDLIRQCLTEEIDLHSIIHITGHGWRKLMRFDEPFVYRIEVVRGVLPEIQLLIDRHLVDSREAYATFNMGAGLALMVAEADVERVIQIAGRSKLDAWRSGTVIKNRSVKSVEIVPLDICYEADSLRLK